MEMILVLTVVAAIFAAAIWSWTSFIDRQDGFHAERSLDRVAAAQFAHALSHGFYAFGEHGAASDLAQQLPRELTDDLAVTHAESTDPGVVSVAVGDQGTLVLATSTPERSCVARSYPAPTATERESTAIDVAATESCTASGLLPAPEVPIWLDTGAG